MSENYSLQTRVVRGGFWISLGFASQQGLAAARTFVLARLLTPEDFGLMGFTILILFAGEMLTDLNVSSALIQRPQLCKRYCDTAWTLSVLKGLVLAAALIGSSPFIARTLGHLELIPYLRAGAANFVLVSLPLIPGALLIRELRYRDYVLLNIAREIVTVTLSISLGLWLHSAWALLLGVLGGQLTTAVGVWFIHGYRPEWLLDKESLTELWRFGMPLYISNLITYLVTRGDDLVVGKLRGISALGQYQVVFGIAEMLTRGLSDLIARVVFPAYSQIVSQGRDLRDSFSEVWRVFVLLLLPITGILVVLPSEVIRILLGNQWLSATSALALLAIAETLRAMAVPLGNIIVASGNTAYLSRIKLVEAAAFSALILPFTYEWGIAGAAGTLILVYLFTLAGTVYMANRVTRIVQPFANGLVEPLGITVIIALIVIKIPRSGNFMTILSVMTWGFLWGLYILLRHHDLLLMLISTLKRDVAVAGD